MQARFDGRFVSVAAVLRRGQAVDGLGQLGVQARFDGRFVSVAAVLRRRDVVERLQHLGKHARFDRGLVGILAVEPLDGRRRLARRQLVEPPHDRRQVAGDVVAHRAKDIVGHAFEGGGHNG